MHIKLEIFNLKFSMCGRHRNEYMPSNNIISHGHNILLAIINVPIIWMTITKKLLDKTK